MPRCAVAWRMKPERRSCLLNDFALTAALQGGIGEKVKECMGLINRSSNVFRKLRSNYKYKITKNFKLERMAVSNVFLICISELTKADATSESVATRRMRGPRSCTREGASFSHGHVSVLGGPHRWSLVKGINTTQSSKFRLVYHEKLWPSLRNGKNTMMTDGNILISNVQL